MSPFSGHNRQACRTGRYLGWQRARKKRAAGQRREPSAKMREKPTSCTTRRRWTAGNPRSSSTRSRVSIYRPCMTAGHGHLLASENYPADTGIATTGLKRECQR